MLILNPRHVTFAAATWPDVTLITLSRRTTRVVLDWSDNGPHPTFADCPEQRTDIKLMMEVQRGDLDGPRPGDTGTLAFFTSPTTADGARRRVSMTAVVVGVGHEVSLKAGAVRTIDLVAVSSDGAADPVTISSAD